MTVQALPPLPASCPVSICIPAHGEAEPLARLLDSIAALDHPADLVETVVAVDGPDPVLEAVARQAGARTVMLPVNRGSYAARNVAIDALGERARVVLFTDADAVVSPGWVREHVRALQSAHVSGGGIRFVFSDPSTPAESVDASRHLNQRLLVESLGHPATVNTAVRREVLADIRFDESLRSSGDRAFGKDVRAASFVLVYTKDAWISHPARRTTAELLHKVARVARGHNQLHASGQWSGEVRNYRREPPVARARREGRSRGWLWELRVRALDQLCTVVWVVRAPQAIGPAVARRVRLWLGRGRKPSASASGT